ncbi:MAG: type I DNA topoisomerase [Actinomycetota bacterium]
MAKNTKSLVVVESPTKAKTLERYLGPDFSVKASVGHIRDLPQSGLGVDTERNFEPQYVVPEEKQKVVDALKAAHRRAGDLYLATDFDREGEAIAFHVAEVLGVDPGGAKRVTFTEITEGAVQEAFAHPRGIDLRLVEAQQARRILDRLVGYTLSPLLMRKVRRGLSAGRVQSPALRMIVEREREIEAFEAVEYWTVDARLTPDGEDAGFTARLLRVDEDAVVTPTDRKKGTVLDEAAAREHAGNLERATYRVAEVRRSERKRRPAPPFTTSTMQQEASRKLGFSARKTMRTAQQLYEGVALPGEGPVGLITYHRTDSTHLAEQFLTEARGVVKEQFGERYALAKPRRYRTKQRGAQEAHEAIRPTLAGRLPDQVASHLTRDQARLYRLIWQRAVASQMAEALLDQVSTDIEAAAREAPAYLLRATGQTVRFDGFRRVYFEGRDDAVDEDAESRLPELATDQALRLLAVLPEQHFTQPPPRYTEASLVKELEAKAIGRPSTYATIVSNLLDRDYVRLEERRFFANEVGMVVIERVLKPHFSNIVDYDFTARMEEELDEIAEGKLPWTQVLDEFFGPWERLLEKKEEEIERADVTSEATGETCPKCGKGNLVKKLGRAGMFISCDRYPECDYARDIDGGERAEPEVTDEICPECGAPMVVKRSRWGPFLGCSRYPECKGKRSMDKSTGITCPECGQGELVVKRTRRGKTFYGCNRYPECEFSVWQRPAADPCPRCGGLQVATAKGTKCTACDYVSEGGGPTEAA